MNRYLLALSITLLAGNGCSGGSGGSAGDSDSAPSNSFLTAPRLADAAVQHLSCPSFAVEKGARISAPGQSYFEIFRLTEQTGITLYTTRAEFDTFCTLQDERGTPLASDDAGGEGDNCSVSASLPKGSYALEVRAYDNQATGEFYLGSRCGSTPPSSDPSIPASPPSSSVPSTPAEDIGDISFTLEWSHSGSSRTEGPDIDIWVENPKGERLSSSPEGLQLGPDSFGGRIDADDRGGWGDGDGNGIERVFWPENSAPPGTYRVGVRYYDGDGDALVLVRAFHGSTGVFTWFVNVTAPGPAVVVGTTVYP